MSSLPLEECLRWRVLFCSKFQRAVVAGPEAQVEARRPHLHPLQTLYLPSFH